MKKFFLGLMLIIMITVLTNKMDTQVKASESNSYKEYMKAAEKFMTNMIENTQNAADEYTIAEYDINNAICVSIYDNIDGLKKKNTEIINDNVKKQLYVPYITKQNKNSLMIFDITNNNIEYNSSIYDCKDRIDYIYNINRIEKEIGKDTEIYYAEIMDIMTDICYMKTNTKDYIIPFFNSELDVNLKSNNKYESSYFYNIIDKYYDDSTYYDDSVKIEDMAKDKDVPFGGRIAVKKKVEKSDKAINIHFIIGLVIAIFGVMSIGILKIKNSKGKYKR